MNIFYTPSHFLIFLISVFLYNSAAWAENYPPMVTNSPYEHGVDSTPAACTPSCAGLTCGDDGCGGSCGNCAVGENCTAGTCVALSGAGGPCSNNGDCTSGACDGNGGTCLAAHPSISSGNQEPGDACTTGDDCVWGMCCLGGTCFYNSLQDCGDNCYGICDLNP